MGPHAIHIQWCHDGEKQWLTIMYKLTDEEVEDIIDDWHIEWKLPFSIEDLSDTKVGPRLEIPVEHDEAKGSD